MNVSLAARGRVCRDVSHCLKHRSAWRELLTRRFAPTSPRKSGRGDFRCVRFALARVAEPKRRLQDTTTTDCVADRANQAWLGPVLAAKINRFD